MDSVTQAQYAYKAVQMKDGVMKKEDQSAEEDVEELSGFNPKRVLKGGIATMGAAATIGLNAFALAVHGGALLVTTTAVATGTSATVAYRELTMDDIDSVRDAVNIIRQEVNRFANENNRLTSEVDRLEQGVFTLKETEGHLKEITGQQDLNVKNLVNLVSINQKILDEKQKLVRQDVVASVVDAVLKADIDDSGDFSPKEVRRMINFIKGLPSVAVDEELLQKALDKNKSVGSIIDIVNDLGRDDIPEERRIFKLDFHDNALAKSCVERQAKEEEKKKAKRRSKRSHSPKSRSGHSPKRSPKRDASKAKSQEKGVLDAYIDLDDEDKEFERKKKSADESSRASLSSASKTRKSKSGKKKKKSSEMDDSTSSRGSSSKIKKKKSSTASSDEEGSKSSSKSPSTPKKKRSPASSSASSPKPPSGKAPLSPKKPTSARKQAGADGDKILLIQIVSCRNLIAADKDGTSDPYVRIIMGIKDLHKTKHLRKTLNPVFSKDNNNEYVLDVSKKDLYAKRGIQIKVMDWDRGLSRAGDDDLGTVYIYADMLYNFGMDVREFKLDHPSGKNKDAGYISIRCTQISPEDRDSRKKSLFKGSFH